MNTHSQAGAALLAPEEGDTCLRMWFPCTVQEELDNGAQHCASGHIFARKEIWSVSQRCVLSQSHQNPSLKFFGAFNSGWLLELPNYPWEAANNIAIVSSPEKARGGQYVPRVGKTHLEVHLSGAQRTGGSALQAPG